jgi:Monooxygenase af470-like
MTNSNRRMTSAADGDVVVFLIGMRVNRWWKPWQWLRTAMAMPRMLRELGRHPELGFLGAESYFGRTTLMVSYWKSTEHLMAYAKLGSAEHLPAWRAFNKHVGTNGDVGIWHETYRAPVGAYESLYVNMPAFGLGRATGLREATGHRASAAGRLAGKDVPASTTGEVASDRA